jgi:hypothetical protein
VVLLLEGLRSRKVLVIREYGGHEDLRGSGRRSVIPYVHGRKGVVLLCLSARLRSSLFSPSVHACGVQEFVPVSVVCPDLL